MSPELLTNDEKVDIVLKRNTYFFSNNEFEHEWEAHVSSIANLLLLLKRELDSKDSIVAKKQVVVDVLLNKHDGLPAVLSLTSGLRQSS